MINYTLKKYSLAAILSLICLCGGFIELAAADLIVRSELSASPPFWVGQRVTAKVIVLAAGTVRKNPQLGSLNATGALVMRSPDAPIYHNELIDGVQYNGRIVYIEIFPQRAEGVELSAISIRQVVDGKMYTGTSPALAIPCTRPPGSERLQALISTPLLSVTEKWKIQAGTVHQDQVYEFRQGDAVQREISWKAEDFLGMALPPFPTITADGLRVYVEKSVPQDRSSRGSLRATRIDVMTYVCEQAGTYIIPAVRIPWFDTRSQRMKYVDFPARNIRVLALETGNEASLIPEDAGKNLVWILLVSLCLVLVLIVSLLKFPILQFWKSPQEVDVALRAWSGVRRALRDSDLDELHRQLCIYMRYQSHEQKSQAYKNIAHSMQLLTSWRFGTGPKPRIQDLRQALHAITPRQTENSNSLPELNNFSH